jgi:hypothetical protein
LSKKIVMPYCRISGQEFYFPFFPPELVLLESGNAQRERGNISLVMQELALSRRTVGWVAGTRRRVETWSALSGSWLKVSGGCDVYILPGGRGLVPVEAGRLKTVLSGLDREILLGPALVLALALRGTWCLHASAASFRGQLIAFLGESGQGKSTLAAYLTASGGPDWRLVADDILPATMGAGGLLAWPSFPQLKLPPQQQPGPGLPESLPVSRICMLADADAGEKPVLQSIPSNQAAQMLLSHTAGARLFDSESLTNHLTFCAQAAKEVPMCRLLYPHRKAALPAIKKTLESSC